MRSAVKLLPVAMFVVATHSAAAVVMDTAKDKPASSITRSSNRGQTPPTRTRHTAKTLSSARQPDAPTVSTVAIKRPTFDGGYVGAFGGISTAEPQAGQPTVYGATDTIVDPSRSLAPTPFAKRLRQGGFVGGLAGYGASSGALYFGVEGRGQFDDSRAAATSAAATSSGPPSFRVIQFVPAGGPFPPLPQLPPYDLTTSSVTRSTVEVLGGGDLSGRIGWMIDEDWMVYGRFGGGASVIRTTSRTSSASTTCAVPAVRRQVIPGFPFLVDSALGCSSVSSATNIVSSAGNRLSPYLTFGLGVERNFGPFFGRIEGEIQQHLGSSRMSGPAYATAMSEPLFDRFYQLRLGGAVGYRW